MPKSLLILRKILLPERWMWRAGRNGSREGFIKFNLNIEMLSHIQSYGFYELLPLLLQIVTLARKCHNIVL